MPATVVVAVVVALVAVLHATPRARPEEAGAARVVVGVVPVTEQPRHQRAVEAHALKAAVAIATMTHSPHAPMRTWVPIWVTAIRATAVRAMGQAVSPTPCAPAWTAWLNAAAVVVAAVVIATLEVAAMVEEQARVAVVAGATGLVGQAVLAALLTADTRKASPANTADAAGVTVHVLHAKGRRAPALNHPRLQLHAVDFGAMPALPRADDVYITLGTTMAAAGSQSAFRAVDYDAVMATARAARAAGATRCGVVTAMGANAQSRIFYNRVKGEVERDLQQLGFETLVIARPSLLIGERRVLQQAHRPAESLSLTLFQWLNPILPANYRARPGAEVARALVHAVQLGRPGLQVLSGRALQTS